MDDQAIDVVIVVEEFWLSKVMKSMLFIDLM